MACALQPVIDFTLFTVQLQKTEIPLLLSPPLSFLQEGFMQELLTGFE